MTPLCRVLSPLNWCPAAAGLFTAKKLLKLHKVEKQKALGSFREGRVVRFCGQDPPWSQSRVSHARHVGAAAGSLQHVRRLGDDAGSLQQAVEGRQSWLRDTDLPLHFRESELLKREAPGRTVQGKVRFSRACPHPNIQWTGSKRLRLVCNARAQEAQRTGYNFNQKLTSDSKK